MNIRECKQCHRMVDFDEPWCDHETMEESAWLDIMERVKINGKRSIELYYSGALDEIIHQVAKELGMSAGKDIVKLRKETFDK